MEFLCNHGFHFQQVMKCNSFILRHSYLASWVLKTVLVSSSQKTKTCLKSTIETLKSVSNIVLVSSLLTLNIVYSFVRSSSVDFEQDNGCWVITQKSAPTYEGLLTRNPVSIYLLKGNS